MSRYLRQIGYDVMGRPMSRTESGLFSTWTFGVSQAAHNVGQVTEARACTDSGCATVVSDKTFAYDSLGRPYTTTINGGSTNYTYTQSYDSNGRLAATTFPSGFIRNNVYTALSYLCSVTDNSGSPTCTGAGGSNVYWTANTADAELHTTQATAGNGIVTTNTYDTNTGRLTNVRAGPSNSVAQFDYTWDTIGNLTYRADGYQGTFEYFCYDALNRLTNSAIGNTATSCTSSGTGITTKTVGYDALGDITSKSDVGSYAYPAGGQVRPHAVTSITGMVNGVVNPQYNYDADGNLTCVYASGGSCASPARAISYKSFNMADTATQGTTTVAFTYDGDHQRITQAVTISGGTTTTTYLNDPATGSMSEVVSGATPTWRDFVMVGGSIVAERFCTGSAPCSSGATLRYFTADHLGSTATLTDGSGNVAERLSYDAWGKRRNANGTDDTSCSLTSASTRGFTAQEHIDSLCAINLNARVYDPVIGRIISADSVVPNAFDGQAYNRYSYVENRLLSETDPSGHDSCSSGGGGGGYGAGGCVETVVVTAEPISDTPTLDLVHGFGLTILSPVGLPTLSIGTNIDPPLGCAAPPCETVVVTADPLPPSPPPKKDPAPPPPPRRIVTAGFPDLGAPGFCTLPLSLRHGYFDLNVTGGYGLGATAGVMINLKTGDAFVYGGGGAVTPGLSVAGTWAPFNTAGPGWNVGVQATGIASGQFGYTFGTDRGDPNRGWFGEGGLGWPPGVSLTVYRAWYVGNVCRK